MTSEHKCPQCKNPVSWQGNPDRPFCSERCRLIDLGQWVDESYRIAGQSQDESVEDNLLQFENKNKPLKGPV